MQRTTAVRVLAAVALAGAVAMGAVSPASATPTHWPSTGHHLRPADTGWNGT
jgi:hypothetical protein